MPSGPHTIQPSSLALSFAACIARVRKATPSGVVMVGACQLAIRTKRSLPNFFWYVTQKPLSGIVTVMRFPSTSTLSPSTRLA